MMQAFSAIVDGLVSFLHFLTGYPKHKVFSSLYSDRKNSRKTSLPFEERNIISSSVTRKSPHPVWDADLLLLLCFSSLYRFASLNLSFCLLSRGICSIHTSTENRWALADQAPAAVLHVPDVFSTSLRNASWQRSIRYLNTSRLRHSYLICHSLKSEIPGFVVIITS